MFGKQLNAQILVYLPVTYVLEGVVNVKFEFCSFTDVEISFYQEV